MGLSPVERDRVETLCLISLSLGEKGDLASVQNPARLSHPHLARHIGTRAPVTRVEHVQLDPCGSVFLRKGDAWNIERVGHPYAAGRDLHLPHRLRAGHLLGSERLGDTWPCPGEEKQQRNPHRGSNGKLTHGSRIPFLGTMEVTGHKVITAGDEAKAPGRRPVENHWSTCRVLQQAPSLPKVGPAGPQIADGQTQSKRAAYDGMGQKSLSRSVDRRENGLVVRFERSFVRHSIGVVAKEHGAHGSRSELFPVSAPLIHDCSSRAS